MISTIGRPMWARIAGSGALAEVDGWNRSP
jgi:hypothetical protein